MNEKVKHIYRQIRHFIKKMIDAFFGFFGFALVRSGNEFLDPKEITEAAKKQGVSVNEYVEKNADDKRKIGRRDRVIARMQSVGALDDLDYVCEIGPGTGRYLEKVIELGVPKEYDIYETHIGWRKYLKDEYSGFKGCKVNAIAANGQTLSETKDKTCDLVHVHAVFVYLPILQCLTYVKEAFRVCKINGFVMLDFIPSESFDKKIAEAWLASPHKWPVLIPEHLVLEIAKDQGFELVDSFKEVYGESFVNYLTFKRI